MNPHLEELHQIHEYIRHSFGVYVTWFTFFIVLLLGSMGWAARYSFCARGRFTYPLPFLLMLFLFIVQLGFSIWATAAVRENFLAQDRRALELLALLEPRPDYYVPASPTPPSLHLAMKLMHYTLYSNLVFWVSVAGILLLLRHRDVVPPAPGVQSLSANGRTATGGYHRPRVTVTSRHE